MKTLAEQYRIAQQRWKDYADEMDRLDLAMTAEAQRDSNENQRRTRNHQGKTGKSQGRSFRASRLLRRSH